MSSYLHHFRARTVATLRGPGTLAIMVGTGLSTFLLWPHLPGTGGGRLQILPGDVTPSGAAGMVAFLWLWLWPMLAATSIGGRASAPGRSGIFLMPHSPLPISARARAVIEVAVVLLFVFAVRAPALVLGRFAYDVLGLSGSFPGHLAFAADFASRTIIGATLALPVLVAWVMPGRSANEMFTRSAAVAGLQLVAMRLNLCATPTRSAAVALALMLVQLALVGREWHIPAVSLGRRRRGALERPARHPKHQLVRDFLMRPLPLLTTLLGIHVAMFAADRLARPQIRLVGDDGPGLFYFASVVLMGLALGFVALRPMQSAQAIAGTVGKPGYKLGDMLAAWSVLPVRREWVLRGVYLHGLLTTAGIWAVGVGTAWLTVWLDVGGPVLASRAGTTIRELLIPLGAVAPCVAGLLAASAAGRKGMALLAAAAMVMVFQGYPALLILKAPAAARSLVLVVLVCLGGLPALGELFGPMRTRERT